MVQESLLFNNVDSVFLAPFFATCKDYLQRFWVFSLFVLASLLNMVPSAEA